ncbi:Protein SCAI [Morella rubra]|uniref:Protein SCAI n=1 Tax=Morella rubra TaxID=262757 RepID=A0A6A1WBN5_9ROSI|nr:Protein SCAI [Morella rubra]KAB1221390.1 Protein SCAI [Morella rubra]
MSQHSANNNSNSSSNVIPVSEVYWSLVEKADKKFSKIRDLPYYQRNRYDAYFYKVFKVYTQLWKFQQENRQKLVEAGLKRWEIGEIASRIAQLYFGQYMRTSEASYLSESYVFYEAIFTREYFKEGLFQDVNLANKQLRFLARFLMVCLVLNRREMINQLVNQLKMLVDECKRTFQETDFKEWKLVVQEIVRFLKADTAFMNIRPLRYSPLVDPHPDSLPPVLPSVGRRNLRLQDAILSSYHNNEVKFSELTLDTFRMLQCLEWEPSGAFYQPSSARVGPNGAPGPSRMNYSQDITDPTLPRNPRKAVLYRPSVTHFLAVLATSCEELPLDGVLLIYLSASGSVGLGPEFQEIGCEVLSEMGVKFSEKELVSSVLGHDKAIVDDGVEQKALEESTQVRELSEGLGKKHIQPMSNVYSRKKFQGGAELVGVDLVVPVASSSHQAVGFVDVEMMDVGGGSPKGLLGGLEGVDDHSVDISGGVNMNDVEGRELVCGEVGDLEMEVEPLAVCFPVGEKGEDMGNGGMSDWVLEMVSSFRHMVGLSCVGHEKELMNLFFFLPWIRIR